VFCSKRLTPHFFIIFCSFEYKGTLLNLCLTYYILLIQQCSTEKQRKKSMERFQKNLANYSGTLGEIVEMFLQPYVSAFGILRALKVVPPGLFRG